MQASLRLATAELRQAPNCGPRSTLAHSCRRWVLHSLSDLRTSANFARVTRHGNETSRMCSLMQARRLLFPGGIPGHSFLRSATQCPIAKLSCAIALDDHNIKIVPIIKMIFTTVVPSISIVGNLSARTYQRRASLGLSQIKLTTAQISMPLVRSRHGFVHRIS